MKNLLPIGVLVIVLGVLALAYQGLTYTSRETVLDVGPIHATADRQRTILASPIAGLAIVAAGIALVVVGARKRG